MAQDDTGYFGERPSNNHRVEDVTDIDPAAAAALRGQGYDNAEQVLAAGAVPGIAPYLADAIGGDVETLLSSLREAVGPPVAMLMEAPMMAELGLGVLPPSDEVQAEMASLLVEMPEEGLVAALPPSVNHAQRMSPVRQQGSRGTCVGFAITAMHEFCRRQQGQAQDFSEQFLYHQTKQIDGSAGCGTWAVKAAQVLAQLGQAREAIWAYNPNPPCNDNGVQPATALADAGRYKLQCVVLNPKDVQAIKTALAAGCVCEVSVPVYNSWFQSAAVRQTGRITMRLPGEPLVGGHAMCAIGYQDDPSAPGGGFFVLRNSWGTSWASQSPYGGGNGTIPYAYIAGEGWEAVTTNVPRRVLPQPWRWRERDRPWPFSGGEGEHEEGARRRLVIELPEGMDIVIR